MSKNDSPHVKEVSMETPLDLEKIHAELQMLPPFDRQIYLQGTDPTMDPLEPTRGSNYLHVDKNELEYAVPLFNMPYINALVKHFDVVRTRVMIVKPKTCYSYHRDTTKRLHIPVVSNEHCFLLVDKQAVHLPVGGIYIVDTTQEHTALNASSRARIHIVGAFKT